MSAAQSIFKSNSILPASRATGFKADLDVDKISEREQSDFSDEEGESPCFEIGTVVPKPIGTNTQ
jgi:hypothetical protein